MTVADFTALSGVIIGGIGIFIGWRNQLATEASIMIAKAAQQESKDAARVAQDGEKMRLSIEMMRTVENEARVLLANTDPLDVVIRRAKSAPQDPQYIAAANTLNALEMLFIVRNMGRLDNAFVNQCLSGLASDAAPLLEAIDIYHEATGRTLEWKCCKLYFSDITSSRGRLTP
jgi:hypothetical protein